jgi:threonine synthase
MQLYSTRKKSPLVSFEEALFKGQAPDGGLYLPTEFPVLNESWQREYSQRSYNELAFYILDQLIGDEFSSSGLEEIINAAYSFSPQLTHNSDTLTTVELFHGPTLSFKDFGAQFMAKTMGHFLKNKKREITILVATSGDTGSAVAHAYHNVEGIRIVLLYPANKVSRTQEMQFTTLGNNITALEIDGTFDDCQAIVKTAFRDDDLRQRMVLSSANSINIGRLLPQSIYYFWSAAKIKTELGVEPTICVPSGNFGNICAGLCADLIGAPIDKFVAAVNQNDVIAKFNETGEYEPKQSISTLSNAMDVGRPSNWERIQILFDNDFSRITERMWSTSISNHETRSAMKRSFEDYNYIIDPHTAVGLEGLCRYNERFKQNARPALVFSTAHPAKFHQVVEETLGNNIEMPTTLKESLEREKQSIMMSSRFDDFKQLLLELN